jgi:dimeric dUTPase (all-alpha-NTP-PPase superfamily)
VNLSKLFEMQAVLDQHIMDEHPELKGQNNLDWKILALLVELSECANEWRGFKKWSKDQEPRKEVKCHACKGKGEFTHHNSKNGVFSETCGYCNGTGIQERPLLEEYVDCLHFILSIGLESAEEWLIDADYTAGGFNKSFWNIKNTIEQFQIVFRKITDFSSSYDAIDFVDLVDEFLGLGEMLGFTWEEIEQAYLEKNAVNHSRQESGY